MKNIYRVVALTALFISGLSAGTLMSKVSTAAHVEKIDSFDWDALVDEAHSPFEQEIQEEIAHHKPPSWLMVKLRQFGCFLLDTHEKIEKWWQRVRAWTAVHMRVAQIKIIRK